MAGKPQESDRRMSPDLPRGTIDLIGGELNVDEPRLRTNKTLQSLHQCSVGYHPCHTDDLAMKAYPCKVQSRTQARTGDAIKQTRSRDGVSQTNKRQHCSMTE
jgi:hypothetical protein